LPVRIELPVRVEPPTAILKRYQIPAPREILDLGARMRVDLVVRRAHEDHGERAVLVRSYQVHRQLHAVTHRGQHIELLSYPEGGRRDLAGGQPVHHPDARPEPVGRASWW